MSFKTEIKIGGKRLKRALSFKAEYKSKYYTVRTVLTDKPRAVIGGSGYYELTVKAQDCPQELSGDILCSDASSAKLYTNCILKERSAYYVENEPPVETLVFIAAEERSVKND